MALKPSIECFRRVDGRLVRWVVKPSAIAYDEIILNALPCCIRGCNPHNGFYEFAKDSTYQGNFLSLM